MTDREVMQQTLEALQYGKTHKAITILREALEQPEQQAEPVAWTTMPEAEDWCFVSGGKDPTGKLEGKWFPLYTTPPKRPWQGLTEADWEWVADKKETSLDTFAHGAAWAADQLKGRNK